MLASNSLLCADRAVKNLLTHSGEHCKYCMGQKNGIHMFGYNSAESEPIWM